MYVTEKQQFSYIVHKYIYLLPSIITKILQAYVTCNYA
jgi:hypothetical protein